MTFGGGENLGSAYGEIIISAEGVRRGVDEAKRQFRSGLSEIGSMVSDLGSSMSSLGASMTALTAPIVAGFGVSVVAATNFEESMSNIQAVTGDTAEETAALGEQLQAVGENSRYGAQAIAEAYYDVAGGVADASARMDILTASVSLAQAGNVELGAATSSMISIMNSYGFSAEQASFASDVLTRTVGMGVGTMGDFASALPQVTGLANSMGISFDQLAASAAYLTTQGNTASQASTQLGAMMTTLLSPTAALEGVIHGLGYANGQAMVDALGLAGAYRAIREAGGGSFAGIITNTEALRGATALTNDAFNQFAEDFNTDLDGITQRTEDIQMMSPAAQFDLLRSTISSLAIDIGQALLPTLVEMVQAIRPVVQSVINWVRQNPGLIRTIAMIVGGIAGLGAILMPLGGIISAIGGAIGLIAGPIGLAVAAVAGLGFAFETNFMGIRDIADRLFGFIGTAIRDFSQIVGSGGSVFDGLRALGETIYFFFSTLTGSQEVGSIFSTTFMNIVNAVQSFITPIQGAITTFFEMLSSGFEPLVAFYFAIQTMFGSETAAGVTNFLVGFRDGLSTIIAFVTGTVLPGLQSLVSWFITDGLPTAINFVTGTVLPILTDFVTFLGDVWTTVSPGLFMLADWFITTAMPAVLAFITDMVVPGFEAFIGLIMGIWDAVSPTLLSLLDWFTVSALPSIVAFMTDTVGPTIQSITDFITGIWTLGSVALQALADWWNSDTLTSAIGGVSDVVEAFQTVLSGIWNAVQPVLQPILDFFNNLLAPVREVINTISSLGGAVNGSGNNYMAAPDVGVGTLGGYGGSRDSGGPVRPNRPYYIGTGAQPELFIPETAGTMVPANQQNNYNSGMTISGPITIVANSYAEGEAAARGFRDEIEAERRRRG